MHDDDGVSNMYYDVFASANYVAHIKAALCNVADLSAFILDTSVFCYIFMA